MSLKSSGYDSMSSSSFSEWGSLSMLIWPPPHLHLQPPEADASPVSAKQWPILILVYFSHTFTYPVCYDCSTLTSFQKKIKKCIHTDINPRESRRKYKPLYALGSIVMIMYWLSMLSTTEELLAGVSSVPRPICPSRAAALCSVLLPWYSPPCLYQLLLIAA